MIDFIDKRFFLYKHLLSYKPFDDNENFAKEKIVELLEKYSNCFERDNIPGHITGSAILLDKQLKNVLLTHHKKLGKWIQFGGHADGDGNPFNVVLRESVEESKELKWIDINNVENYNSEKGRIIF